MNKRSNSSKFSRLSFSEFDIDESVSYPENALDSSRSGAPQDEGRADFSGPKKFVKIGVLTNCRFVAEGVESQRKKRFLNPESITIDMFAPKRGLNTSKCQIFVGSASHKGLRPSMEDTCVLSRKFHGKMGYFAIFDGHNGPGASEYAKRHLQKLIASNLESLSASSYHIKVSKKQLVRTESHHYRHFSSFSDEEILTKSHQLHLHSSSNEGAITESHLHHHHHHHHHHHLHSSPPFSCLRLQPAESKQLALLKYVKADNRDFEDQRSGKSTKATGESHNFRSFDVFSSERNEEEEGELSKVLKDSFIQLDRDYEAFNPLAEDGSTALVCITDNMTIHIAHIGDSRAVLSRSIPYNDDIVSLRMTNDHKPDDEKEQLRILNNGGQVKVWNGCARVGLPETKYWLAVSRSFGNYVIKRCSCDVMICEPDYLRRHLLPYEDEFIVMASDGLWDVMDDLTVCRFIKDFIKTESTSIEREFPSSKRAFWEEKSEVLGSDITPADLSSFPASSSSHSSSTSPPSSSPPSSSSTSSSSTCSSSSSSSSSPPPPPSTLHNHLEHQHSSSLSSSSPPSNPPFNSVNSAHIHLKPEDSNEPSTEKRKSLVSEDLKAAKAVEKRRQQRVSYELLSLAASKLIDEALRLGSQDNITCIILYFQW